MRDMQTMDNRFRILVTIIISTWFLCEQSVCAQVREAWLARHGDSDTTRSYATSSALDPDGNLVVTGIVNVDYSTLKYDTRTGQPIWIANLRVGIFSHPTTAVDRTGDVFVSGTSFRSSTRDDYVTIKYNGQTGEQLWIARYNGPGNDRDRALASFVDYAGNVFVTGYSTGMGTNTDYTTIKYHGQTGEQLWVARYNGPGNGADVARAIAIDPEGNLLISGYSTGAGTHFDYATIKYNGETGQQLWVARYNGIANSADYASALATDSSGHVYVTGGASEAERQRVYTTIKYDGQSGQTLWISSSAYTGRDADVIAVNSVGDVFVTGDSDPLANCPILRYSGQTGQLLWIQSLRGRCKMLVLDREDNIYVAGSSNSGFPGPIGDFRTVKFDGRTGNLLWQRTFPDAYAFSLAVDDDGSIYVTGFEGPEFEENYLTIKYEQAPPGDVDYNFCVDDGDLVRILLAFGEIGELPEDLNRDGVVDDKDLLMVLFNFGRGCRVD